MSSLVSIDDSLRGLKRAITGSRPPFELPPEEPGGLVVTPP